MLTPIYGTATMKKFKHNIPTAMLNPPIIKHPVSRGRQHRNFLGSEKSMSLTLKV